RQELGLVEQPGQQSLQPGRAGQAEQQPLTARLPAEHPELAELVRVADALPVQVVREILAHDERTLEVRLVDDPGRQGRDHAHHRPGLHEHRLPGRRHEPVVIEPVGLVPQPLAVQGLADGGEMLEEPSTRSVAGRCPDRPRTAAMGARGIAEKPIQPVASDCSSVPPTGRCERSSGPMLSSPRNPPSKTLLPSLSSRLTHQVKLTSSLSKTRLRKSMSRPPSTPNTSSAAQAWTGGFTSEKSHS